MKLRVNGHDVEVMEGSTVAVAIATARVQGFSPLCAMGVCYQCRATIDGTAQRRSCLVICREDMEVRTDGV